MFVFRNVSFHTINIKLSYMHTWCNACSAWFSNTSCLLHISQQGQIFKLKVGWVTVHMWGKQVQLHTQHWLGKSEGCASMRMLLLGEIQGMLPRKSFKITYSEIESEDISNILFQVRVFLTLAVRILATLQLSVHL